MERHTTVEKQEKNKEKKKMVHAVMVKWDCSVCDGIETATDKHVYSEKEPEVKHESLIKIKDLGGNGEPISLCPRCAYKAMKILAKIVALDNAGYKPMYVNYKKVIESEEKKRTGVKWWRKKK